jgi:hypothetical protein
MGIRRIGGAHKGRGEELGRGDRKEGTNLLDRMVSEGKGTGAEVDNSNL